MTVISKVAGGATPGSSVQQWAADLTAHVGSDPVHQSFVPALRSDQPNGPRCRYTDVAPHYEVTPALSSFSIAFAEFPTFLTSASAMSCFEVSSTQPAGNRD